MKNLEHAVAHVNGNSYFCHATTNDGHTISFGRGQSPVSYKGYFYAFMFQPITAAIRTYYALARDCIVSCSNGSAAVSLSASLQLTMYMKALTLPATGRTESPLRVMTGISLVPQPITASDTVRRIMRAVRRAVTLQRAAVAVIVLGMACAMFGLMARPSQGAAVLTACGAVTAISATLLYFHLITAGKGGEL